MAFERLANVETQWKTSEAVKNVQDPEESTKTRVYRLVSVVRSQFGALVSNMISDTAVDKDGDRRRPAESCTIARSERSCATVPQCDEKNRTI